MPDFEITSPTGQRFQVTAPDGASHDEVLAFAQQQFQPQPPQSSGPMPVNAGLANFAATAAGLPMETVKNIANLGIAGYGTVKGALGAGLPPDLIQSLPGDIGNTRALMARAASDTGIAGLSPENPQSQDTVGTAAYDLTSRGGFMPGGMLPAIGSMAGEAAGGTPGAIMGAMLPGAAGNVSREIAASRPTNQVRDQTLAAATKEGYKVPPSAVAPTFIGNRLESIAGKAAIKQEATLRNQTVTDGIARRETGLAENSPITEGALQARRNEIAQPYKEVAALSPRATVALENLKQTRFDAQSYWKHYDRQADPNSLAAAKNLDGKAQLYEKMLEAEAKKAGKPDLVGELRDARIKIAKTYDVERALNMGDGTVDARILGRLLDKGKKLSGGLQTAAKFAQGPGAQFTRPSSLTPAPGVSALEPMAAAGFGLGGAAAFGPYGTAAALLPFIRPAVRAGLLSDWYQKRAFQTQEQPQPLGWPALLQQNVIQNRQTGGPVSPGQPYMVGENGPELMIPQTQGNILPAGVPSGGPAWEAYMQEAAMEQQKQHALDELMRQAVERMRMGNVRGTVNYGRAGPMIPQMLPAMAGVRG